MSTLCEVCYEESKKENNVYTCGCGVVICNNCYFDWMSNEIDQSDLSQKAWKCPQSNKNKTRRCNRRMTVER